MLSLCQALSEDWFDVMYAAVDSIQVSALPLLVVRLALVVELHGTRTETATDVIAWFCYWYCYLQLLLPFDINSIDKALICVMCFFLIKSDLLMKNYHLNEQTVLNQFLKRSVHSPPTPPPWFHSR